MSETGNVQLIRQLYDAMSKGDLDAALAMMTDDVTFVVPGPPGIGAAGTWRGHTGVRDCFVRLREAQENQSIDIREFVAQGNTVVVLLHVVAKARSTGKVFKSDIVHFFTIRDARITNLLDFFDTAALVDANRV
ncbi:MAG TPA: nuclear transport factor 2 family protein [Vicinamibacterales bacterium]|nr:nuclear transport factor 2 family protein [Vicinamibacterales bacterium]